MNMTFRTAAAALGVWVLSAPAAILATILLYPFWSWVEDTFRIESVGHSGPAEWCYLVVFLIVAVPATWFTVRAVRRTPRAGAGE